jgi:hypothetical protein
VVAADRDLILASAASVAFAMLAKPASHEFHDPLAICVLMLRSEKVNRRAELTACDIADEYLAVSAPKITFRLAMVAICRS